MVAGKSTRTKQWVSGQIESFSDLEGGGNDDDSDSESGSDQGDKKVNGDIRDRVSGNRDLQDTGLDPKRNWDAFEDLARRQIGTSRTAQRAGFLEETLLKSLKGQALDGQQVSIILKLLIPTYPRYSDYRSREAVLACISAIIQNDLSPSSATGGKLTDNLVKWIDNEITNKLCSPTAPAAAGSTLYSIHSWTCCVLSNISGGTTDGLSQNQKTLLKALAVCYNSLLDGNAKSRVKKSSTVVTRRLLRGIPALLPKILQLLATASEFKPTTLAAPLLGLVIDVTLRLKSRKEQKAGYGRDWVLAAKEDILKYYREHIVVARTPLPVHAIIAFNDFIGTTITEEDLSLSSELVKAMDRALLRNPELALPALDSFFQSYVSPVPLSGEASSSRPAPLDLFKTKLLPAILAASKSSNALTRSSAALLLNTLCQAGLSSEGGAALALHVVKEVGGPMRTNKTASPEHRIALSQLILAVITTAPQSIGAEHNAEALDCLAATLAKESNENALKATLISFAEATIALLKLDYAQLKATAALLAKGMQDTKANYRRLYTGCAGDILWRVAQAVTEPTAALRDYVTALRPGFESALKNASSPGFPSAADGWVTVATWKGPLATWNLALDLFERNVNAQGILSFSPRPSFLLSEKTYRKITDSDDELWLVRALESTAKNPADRAQLERDQDLYASVCAPLMHVALDSPRHVSRAAARDAIASIASEGSSPTISALIQSMVVQLQQKDKIQAPQTWNPDEPVAADHSSRWQVLVVALARGSRHTDSTFVQLLVPSHHEAISGKTPIWIDACIANQQDPAAIVAAKAEALMSTIRQHQSHYDLAFRDAAYNALSTIAFVAPEVIMPLISRDIIEGLSPRNLDFIGETELGIYQTPEGSTYVDVLKTAQKGQLTQKGKNAAIDRWDQETRAALAAKKQGSGPTLSKAERALVDAQLEKEAAIRSRVKEAIARTHQALRSIRCLMKVPPASLESSLPDIASALIDAVTAETCTLFREEAFQTVLALYEACSPRISEIRLSLALAVLRSSKSAVVPEDFQVEDVSALVARVLYRLRFQSEKEPFGPSTFTLAYPLLAQCVLQGGVGIQDGDNDTTLEQLTLVVDIFGFHAPHFQQSTFPRLKTLNSLIEGLLRYPSLGKQLSDALVKAGEAIAANASPQEQSKLLNGLLVDEAQVRHACLQALVPLDLTDLDYSNEIWLAMQDGDDRNNQIATEIWEDNGLDVKEAALAELLRSLGHSSAFVRSSAALGMARAVAHMSQTSGQCMRMLEDRYATVSKEKLPQFDDFGMIIEASLHQVDEWTERVAIAETFGHLAELLQPTEIALLFDLLINKQALGDRSEAVRSKMLEAGISVIDAKGKDNIDTLMKTFQDYLSTTQSGSESQDRVTESLIVLLGRLAGHLDPQDPQVTAVIDRLMKALHTPSEVVQEAVAECLPPLVQANRQKGADVIEHLLRETLHASKYAERRGAAYGLAGAIKGRGISALKEFGIMDRLSDAAEDKKDANARQGALFAFETMSSTLGRLFEPYITKTIPLLLNCLGDSDPGVRQATSDAARVMMSKVSGHGVKLILPALLDALEDRQWRTKKGAIELMGSMAYLAPRQLSISLPRIIPSLTEVITDTHTQVRTAANSSLKKFGDVVDNPEIKAMQRTLLDALVDPTNKTLKALDALLTTSFVHYIDTSSLALIVPIIERGLRERSAELKRKSAQIVGNLASLTDSKDLISYLSQLTPRVQEVLVDPVPEARATAAKALGVLIERLGEDAFPTLLDDLIGTLKSDLSGVDQQGAAQGLSEVLAGLGVERMESMLPEIINYTSSPRAYVREGFISLLIYLPSVFGERFAPYLSRIIQPVLSGLADESEYVREASMRAGRMIVNNHSTKAIDLLLPELERGLFDPSWRIRLSSIQLVGELLFQISGISNKAEFEDDGPGEEEEGTPQSNSEVFKKLLDVLGKDKRDRVLSSIYILRQDSAGQVRMFSLNVWKALVYNTLRTVREMVPALMQIIIRLLAAPGAEQREMTARTLAELCRKQGERILGDIIPILQQAGKGSVASRQGCCLAFAEMLDATTKVQLEGHEDSIIESVRGALVDEEPSVRQAAALAFDALQTQLGPRSIDQTIPTLLGALTSQGAASDAALSALQELMSVRSHAIFPILIPTLVASPISAFNARALASLVGVAGSALNRRLSQILDALQRDAEVQTDAEIKAELESALKSVLASVHDSDGLHMLMLHLLGMAKDPRGKRRAGGCDLFAVFCQVTEEDFSSYHIDWLRQILSLCEDSESNVVAASGRAMDAFAKTLSKDQMEGLSVPLRRIIENMGSPGNEIAGFSQPGGLKPILPIFIQGLLAGTNEQREQSAFGLGDIVERTAVDALKPYVTQITGPLIRIIAERYPAPVKAAILSTLAVLLTRVPQFVRPFFPQLQRTFIKNVADLTSSTVRIRAAAGLGVLMGLQPRIDPIITELVNGLANEEQEVRDSMASALGLVVLSGGANMGPAARDSVANIVSETLQEPSSKDAYNASIARVLAGMVLHEMQQAEPLLGSLLESKPTAMGSVCFVTLLEHAPAQLYSTVTPSKTVNKILKNVISDVPGVGRPAREARDLLKKTAPWSDDEDVQARLA